MTIVRNNHDVVGPEGTFTAYVAAPERPNGVAVVVLQEIFGVNDNIRSIVDGFAEAGYAAVAPDLYWRQQPGVSLDPSSEDGRAQAMKLMGGLNPQQAVSDGTAALAMLRQQVPGLAKAAAVGYCFGGGVAYQMAVQGAVDAGVSYYGVGLQAMVGQLANLKGQLLLHVAGADHLCPPEAQEIIQRAAAPLSDRVTVVVYDGAGHAFARVGGATFDAEAAGRANAKTMELLGALAAAG